MKKIDIHGKVVVVTGASSGIGKALAREFAGKGAAVILAARDLVALENFGKQLQQENRTFLIVQTDVTDEQQCADLIKRTVDRFGRLDILINNAGISMRAMFAELDLSVFKRVMDVNFWGAVYCTKHAMPYLLKARGSVVGISSIAGYVGLPARTAYSASKYGLQGFLDALRTENLRTGLHVLVACPGYTESGIRKRALNASGEPQNDSPLNEGKIMTSEAAAMAIARAVEGRKRTLTLTTEGRMAVFLSRFFPAFMEKMVFNKVTSEPGSPIPLA